MAQKNVLMKAKEQFRRDQLADFLTGLAEQIRSGQVTFVQGAETTEVPVPEYLRVDIELVDELKRRGTKRELELELSWYEDDNGPAPSPSPLKLG